jgi:3'-5' exoribonuclease
MSSCSTAASPRATLCAYWAASSGSATGCSSTSARSRRRTSIPDELRGFLEFLVADVTHPGLTATVRAVLLDAPLDARPATPDGHHSYAGGLLEHTVGVATICRETAQLHPRLRGDLLLAAALVHDVGRVLELGPGPGFAVTEEGRLLGHVQLGIRLVDERAEGLSTVQNAELLHCVATHHDPRAARTAEAAVLHHANALDAVAATRPTG